MKSTKAALVLPEGVKAGSVLTLTYQEPELGPTPYHGIVLSLKKIRGKHLLMALIFYWDDFPDYVAVDLNSGLQKSSIRHSQKEADEEKYKVSRLEICDPNDILRMIGDEGNYDKGEPYTVPGGRTESKRRRH
jgi:hypothetical protein